MKEPIRNFLVGLFVLGAIFVLGVLMVWFGEAPSWLGGSEWTLRIAGIEGLSGIGEGSEVNLNGVQIGRVSNLEFEDPQRPDHGVVVVTRIKKVFSVPRGAVARVYGAMLGFGTGHIDIVIEPGVNLTPLDTERTDIQIPGKMHSIIGELISKDFINSVERTITHIGDLAASATPVSDNLAKLLDQRSVADVGEPGAEARGITPNLSTAVERIDDLAAHLNAVLGDENVQADVKATVDDLKNATAALRETVELWKTESQKVSDNVNAAIARADRNLDQSFVKLNDVMENLSDAAKTLAGLLHEISEGKGTAGLLARDERLYEAGVVALERFGELIGTFQRIAGKVERDGYIPIGAKTSLGTFKENLPVGKDTPPR